ncbi:Phosphoinositide phosphatase SAC1 [Fusarium oxysporum f. sp. albedinis]|nr:Phosphoinositide phosphatase SAC1 [Fusarium oxysporum f. sp. albedinis]
MPSNTSAQATTIAKVKPKSAAFRHRNTRFPVRVDPAKLLERQIIWFANGFPGNQLPGRLEAAVEKAKLQQPNWERYTDKGEDDVITQVLNAPLCDGVTLKWLGQMKGIDC